MMFSMKNIPFLTVAAALAGAPLSSCVAPPPPLIIIQEPVRRTVVDLLPLEITPAQYIEYERLRQEKLLRDQQILNGRVNNVPGY